MEAYRTTEWGFLKTTCSPRSAIANIDLQYPIYGLSALQIAYRKSILQIADGGWAIADFPCGLVSGYETVIDRE
ncbi:MAG: hypothetical protein DMG14_18760 [Acidobacteria bacterium]|nr:MAG: hypothetical protein DMG14_18760 [Acidobacteriota bacterium]